MPINTIHGKGSAEEFIENYKRFGVDKL